MNNSLGKRSLVFVVLLCIAVAVVVQEEFLTEPDRYSSKIRVLAWFFTIYFLVELLRSFRKYIINKRK